MPKIPQKKPLSLAAKLADPRRRTNKADAKRKALRDQLWPGSAAWIWDISDKEAVVGFATLPRLMPWVLHLIQILVKDENKKGDPSAAYLELWCRDYGQCIISITDEQENAYAAGYSSTRAIRTWRDHMLKLVELGFIKAMVEGNREYGQILLLNPIAVCAKLRRDKKVPDEWWTSFVRRAHAIGATIPEPLNTEIVPNKSEPEKDDEE